MAKQTEARVLVIGLDGGTFDVFLPLVQQGHMPHLAALLQRSSWGELASTVPPFTASAWSTFITGQNPGQHGILSFQRRDRYNYDREGSGFVNAEQLGQTLWQILSAAGKKISVINVPMTYPPQAVNGHMITGMLTPSPQANFVYPLQLKERLGEDYMIDVEFIRDGANFRLRDFPSEVEMLNAIRQMMAARARTVLKLWQEEAPWDFAMVVFTSTDRLFHFFWPYVESIFRHADAAPDHQLDPVVLEGVRAYFTELDAIVGQLIDAAGAQATTFLMSDHGFGPAPRWRLYLNVWLEQMGLLAQRPAQGMFDLEYLRVWIGRHRRLKSLLRRFLPQRIQDSATDIARSASVDIVDWHRTEAFFVPIYFQVCGIEINQKGLFREGIVEPGAPYEQLREQIIQKAQKIRNPFDDTPVVELACRREDLYTGPHVEQFPDVILVLDPNYLGAPSLAGRTLIEPHPHPMRSGEHRSNGLFAAAGPHIEAQGQLKNLRLIDVPSTILYELSMPIPDSFDGRVLTELYNTIYVSAHPPRYQAVTTDKLTTPVVALSGEEQTMLEERLRGLGYL
jgi:predicted AlkP superfamily phosphohydrolase/phosphomutase